MTPRRMQLAALLALLPLAAGACGLLRSGGGHAVLPHETFKPTWRLSASDCGAEEKTAGVVVWEVYGDKYRLSPLRPGKNGCNYACRDFSGEIATATPYLGFFLRASGDPEGGVRPEPLFAEVLLRTATGESRPADDPGLRVNGTRFMPPWRKVGQLGANGFLFFPVPEDGCNTVTVTIKLNDDKGRRFSLTFKRAEE